MARWKAFSPYLYLLLTQLAAAVTAVALPFLQLNVVSGMNLMGSSLNSASSVDELASSFVLIPIVQTVVCCAGVTAGSLAFTVLWHSRVPRHRPSVRTRTLAIGGLALILVSLCFLSSILTMFLATAAGCVLWPVALGRALPGFEPQADPLPDSVVCQAAPMRRRNAFHPYLYLLLTQLVATVTAVALLLLFIEVVSGMNQPVSMMDLEDRLANGMSPTSIDFIPLPVVAAVVCGVGVTAVSLAFTAAWHARTPRHKTPARTKALAIGGLVLPLVPLCVFPSMITVFLATAAGCVLWPVLLGWALPGFEPQAYPQPNPTVCQASTQPNGGAQ